VLLIPLSVIALEADAPGEIRHLLLVEPFVAIYLTGREKSLHEFLAGAQSDPGLELAVAGPSTLLREPL